MLKYFLAIWLYSQYKALKLMVLAELNLIKEYLYRGMHKRKPEYRQLSWVYCTQHFSVQKLPAELQREHGKGQCEGFGTEYSGVNNSGMTCDVLLHGLSRGSYKGGHDKNAFILRLLRKQELVH